MKRYLTTLLRRWSPWYLRKRIGELESDLDRLTDIRDNFVASCNRTLVKENERLKNEIRNMRHVCKMNAIAIKGIAQSFYDLWEHEEQKEATDD